MRKWKITALLLLLVLSASAQADKNVQGTVNTLIQRASDGLIYVRINGTANEIGCASSADTFWAIHDEDTEEGKRQFAMLMLAYANRSVVVLTAMSTCNRYPGLQDIQEVRLVE